MILMILDFVYLQLSIFTEDFSKIRFYFLKFALNFNIVFLRTWHSNNNNLTFSLEGFVIWSLLLFPLEFSFGLGSESIFSLTKWITWESPKALAMSRQFCSVKKKKKIELVR